MVVGTAVMGKPPPEPVEGDSLDLFETDLTEAAIIDHLQNPLADPQGILRRATARLVYDLFAYFRTKDQPDPQPAVVYTLARETHDRDPVPAGELKIQHSFSYSDGFGREIQKKIQADPGKVPLRDANGKVIGGEDGQPEMTRNEISPRWVGSGWTVFNNKGKPVRQYEPFFTDTHRFEFDLRIGVSPVLFYDPVERVVATLYPNHTWEKVVFDPWRQETWDVNDTVLAADPENDPDVGEFFRRLPEGDYLPTWHALRANGSLGIQERDAANKAAVHAATPAVAHLDSLSRTFLSVVQNRFVRDGETVAERYATRVELDIEGNQREVIDARDRIVMRYDYDMLGSRIHSASMEAGERWMLDDVFGKPIRAWDSRGHVFRSEYDELRRPTRLFVRGTDVNDPDGEILFERTIYGEGQGNALNHRGRAVQVFDGAGVVTSNAYDFKGNLLRGSRQLLVNYRDAADWSFNPALESQVFTSSTTYDALNRPVTLTTPDNSQIRPSYNEANLLERVEANLRGAGPVTSFVSDIDYNAKGQRELIEYGNGIRTTYEYDPLTFRLTQLLTTRSLNTQLQSLNYFYDPAGNITGIQDDAQQTIYFNNQVVEPHAEYTYDAVYRLIEASGREHIGQVSRPQTNWNDEFRVNLPHPHDGHAMRPYTERYEYDEVGNFKLLHHFADNGQGTWRRSYDYEETSLIPEDASAALTSNRLTRTTVSGQGLQSTVEPYAHDIHGNMTEMPHLPLMEWDFKDQLQTTQKQVVNNAPGDRTYYVYDAAGQRVRKVTERQPAGGLTATRRNERIYLGGFEIFREYEADGTTMALERETLHIMDSQQRIALVETQTQGNSGSPAQLIRHQIGNHLGSAALELDERGAVISYEEFYAYGSTSYEAGRGAAEVSLKRYRYIGKERDEESGLNYHCARYYTAWLGRWIAADPAGLKDGTNLYQFARGNPTMLVDLTGRESEAPPWVLANMLLQAEATRQQAEQVKVKGWLQDYHAITTEQVEAALEQTTLEGQELAQEPELPDYGEIIVNTAVHSLYDAATLPLMWGPEEAAQIADLREQWTPFPYDPRVAPLGEALEIVIGLVPAAITGPAPGAANAVSRRAISEANEITPLLALSADSTLVDSTINTASHAPTLVGASTSQMRRDAAKLIRETVGHPLKFLLDAKGNFKASRGLTHADLMDNPDIVQMGHIVSKKSGEPERIMLQGAWQNQFNNVSIEHPSMGGYAESVAIDIEGVAVDFSTAQAWEDFGWLSEGTVANSKRIH
jgi:RHS repeat-associated protein